MNSHSLSRNRLLRTDELRQRALRRVGLERRPGPGPSHPELVCSTEIAPRDDEAVRLVSLNLGHGRRTASHQALLTPRIARRNVSAVGSVLRKVGADVIGLQEADGPSAWSGSFDHVASLARHAALDHHYRGDHNPFGSDRFPLASGTALVSSWPMAEIESFPFAASWRDTKGFVVARLGVPRWNLEIDVVSVHLDFLLTAMRQQQIRSMIQELASRGRPRIVLGDLNCCWRREPSSLQMLRDELGVRPFEPERHIPTFPAHKPRRRIDWILISEGLEFHAHHTLRTPLSDHLGVVADVRPTSKPGADHPNSHGPGSPPAPQ